MHIKILPPPPTLFVKGFCGILCYFLKIFFATRQGVCRPISSYHKVYLLCNRCFLSDLLYFLSHFQFLLTIVLTKQCAVLLHCEINFSFSRLCHSLYLKNGLEQVLFFTRKCDILFTEKGDAPPGASPFYYFSKDIARLSAYV